MHHERGRNCDLDITHKVTSTIKRSRVLKLIRHFEQCIIQEDKNLISSMNDSHFFYNLGTSISEEKQIEKIIDSLPYWFHVKVTVLESMYKPHELTINELVGDLKSSNYSLVS